MVKLKVAIATGFVEWVFMIASKVGNGLSIDTKAHILVSKHWIEAIDPRHRYGNNLQLYYKVWSKSFTGQHFFFWLDFGDGKEVDLEECPRSKLDQQCVKRQANANQENPKPLHHASTLPAEMLFSSDAHPCTEAQHDATATRRGGYASGATPQRCAQRHDTTSKMSLRATSHCITGYAMSPELMCCPRIAIVRLGFFLSFFLLVLVPLTLSRPLTYVYEVTAALSGFLSLKNFQGSKKGDNIKGLYQVKKYLNQIGCLPLNHDKNDEFDEELESAIMTYQLKYNLEVTGILDSGTVSTMMAAHCGVRSSSMALKTLFQ
ncbi:unnamed protein product [Fraxinus pennsylvanica]|uniref:Peptidoglycan binding-like domain-containing protein n=1 Tax=Fraxinus pennsylvanica TaxID=56036 RepID=A0AAD1ZGQ7_9LAMI|nr:unnamed protein product [Fraxinus pennsylvanica]